jgi:hypothetical protein
MNFQSKLLIAEKLPQHHSTDYRGLGIVIEWPKGSVRTGKDSHGKKWKRVMQCDYGYVPNTVAAGGDKEGLDVYIGSDETSDKVYVVEQLKENGEFDEYKCLLGFPDLNTAYQTYLEHYPADDWEETRVGEVFEVPFDYAFDAIEKQQEEHEGLNPVPKTAAKTDEPSLEEIEATPVEANYIWISPRENENYILKGNYGCHGRFQQPQYMNGHPLTSGQLDASPRGYAEIRDYSKTVVLSTSECCDGYTDFIPESIVQEFQKRYPRYKIYKSAAATGIAKTASTKGEPLYRCSEEELAARKVEIESQAVGERNGIPVYPVALADELRNITLELYLRQKGKPNQWWGHMEPRMANVEGPQSAQEPEAKKPSKIAKISSFIYLKAIQSMK